MSQTGPNALVVIGDTDWWSPLHRHVDIAVDSRLREMGKSGAGAAAFRSVCGNAVRAAGTQKRYAEFFVTGTSPMFGLCKSGAEAAVLPTYPGAVAATVGYYGSDGAIYLNGGGATQSGLPNNAVGDTIGLAYWLDSSTVKVQFYKNGATLGTPVSLTTGDYRLAVSVYTGHASPGTALRVDRDDLVYLPADCAPWGAAARVSDAGGYSPASSKVAAQGNNIGVDAHLRCVRDLSGTDYTGDSARTGNASAGTALLYVELLVEAAATAAKPLIGVCNAAFSMEAQHLGNSGTAAFGYYGSGGNVYVNNAVVATHASFAANDRIGVFLDPLTGKFWLSKNGAIQAGNPEARTGQTGTLAGGPWYPAATPYGANARVRFCTHAREQLYRPTYAQAWDGADVLPEQHYRGVLVGGVEVTRAIEPVEGFAKEQRGGSPIGALSLANQDGRYNPLRRYALRDQSLSMYELGVDDQRARHFARGVCDSAVSVGAQVMRVLSRGADAFLDKAVPTEVFSLGLVAYAPAVVESNSASTFRVADQPYVTYKVIDQGLEVSSFAPANEASAGLFKRTVAPAGKNAVKDLGTFYDLGTLTLTNPTLSAWTADNPNGWTVVENGTTAKVTQNGAAGRFVRNAGAPECSIAQSVNPASPYTAGLFVKVTVSAYVSGGITLSHNGGSTTVLSLSGPGTFWAFCFLSGTGALKLAANDTTDLTISNIEVHEVSSTDSGLYGPRYLIEHLAGRSSNDWAAPQALQDFSLSYGYYTTGRPLLRDVLQRVLRTMAADCYTDAKGVLQLVPLPAFPLTSPVVTLGDADALGEMTVEDAQAPGLSAGGQRSNNYAPHMDSEIAGSVTDSVRKKLRDPFVTRYMQLALSGLDPFYAHAIGAAPMPSLGWFTGSPTEDALNARLRSWAEGRRTLYGRTFQRDRLDAVAPGSVVTLTSNTHDLSSGVNAVVLAMQLSLTSTAVQITAIG